jgi:hypothetical protein
MSPGRDIWMVSSLPRRSEYERSTIDFVRCISSKKDNCTLWQSRSHENRMRIYSTYKNSEAS